jgi:hypothetical protein
MKDHTVTQGECVSSIAFENGLFWETVWNHPANAALKARRESPFILQPGDVVQVPDLRPNGVTVATGKRHVFRRKGVPEKLNLQFRLAGKARAGVPYRLTIDGVLKRGALDGEGRLSEFLPPNARSGKLVLEAKEGEEEYPLQLRHLDPVDTVTGLQARLQNLGLYSGAIDGAMSPATLDALRVFQRRASLTETSELDPATRDALVAAHQS